jgi:magnesium chelatase family protein
VLPHRGVLFLDENYEFGPHVLEMMRTPLEEGKVRFARTEGMGAPAGGGTTNVCHA